MTIINDYLKITREYSAIYGVKTLLLMQVGSFFESYALIEKDGTFSGSKIQEFADINDMTISRKNTCVGDQSVVMAGFGLAQLEKYVKKMQEHGFTIVVYTQDTQTKNTTRSLSCIYSPGTFFNQDTQELSNNTCCIWLHYSAANQVLREQITIGLANIDIFTGKTSIFEFSNDYHHNPCTYDELEKYIAVYNPSETIIISNLEDDIVNNIIQFANITSRQIHKIDIRKNTTDLEKQAQNVEKQKYQREIIKKFFLKSDPVAEYYNFCIASQSLCFLLEFIYRHNPNLVSKIDEPIIENYGNRLILANHSLKQLNIIQDSRFTGRLGSVSSFLNNCVTNIGRRQFNYNLLNPITDKIALNRSYNITEHALKTEIWSKMRIALTNIKDIEKIKRKLFMNKISPRDFANLSNNLSCIATLFQTISDDVILLEYINSFISETISTISDRLIDFINKYFTLSRCLYLDDISPDKLGSLSLDNLLFINKDIDIELDKKTKECVDSREVFECIRKYLSDLVKRVEKTGKTSKTLERDNEFIKIHETPKMDAQLIGTKRRVLILKKELERESSRDLLSKGQIVLKYISKYSGLEETFLLDINQLDFKVHGGNQTNLVITSPQIQNITSNIQVSKDQLITTIILVYNRIIQDFISLQERRDQENDKEKEPIIKKEKIVADLDNIINFISECDTLQCRCYIADKYNYCKPTILDADRSFVKFEKIRHCLIEQLNEKELYVSNDLSLSVANESMATNGILLYGTNAVGKTSLIKSIGIAIIMAQAGLYVPCSVFIYNPYNYIFTRILGIDNIFKGLSTFAVEMSELRTILKLADKNSLILGDELCSGTESTSALSIFTAGLESLHAKEASFIFATHFHEIINYDEIKALTHLKLYHMTVIFNKATKKLIYDRKLREGAGESMYGLEVCKSLDLPLDFLERAYRLRTKYTNPNPNPNPNHNHNLNNKDILSNTVSHFNVQKVRNICEICNIKDGTEVHHLQHQKNAVKGVIKKEFNKNHVANLINICELCHNILHKSNKEHKIVKTSDGYEIHEIRD